MTDKILLVLSSTKSFFDRRFHPTANNWIGVHILASGRGRTSDQQVNPPLEPLPPLEPIPQTVEHSTLLSTDTDKPKRCTGGQPANCAQACVPTTEKI